MARMYMYKSYSGTIQLCVHVEITDNTESRKHEREIEFREDFKVINGGFKEGRG